MESVVRKNLGSEQIKGALGKVQKPASKREQRQILRTLACPFEELPHQENSGYKKQNRLCNRVGNRIQKSIRMSHLIDLHGNKFDAGDIGQEKSGASCPQFFVYLFLSFFVKPSDSRINGRRRCQSQSPFIGNGLGSVKNRHKIKI